MNIRSIFRLTGVLVMMALLAFLTTLNFVVYSSAVIEKRAVAAADTSGQNNAFPDEKVPDNPNTLSEEFLHEQEALIQLTLSIPHSFPALSSPALLSRASAFVSPPPDCC